MRQGERGGLAVGQVLLVAPELGGEGLHAGGHQDQGGGELGDRGEEDQAEGGGQPGRDKRPGDPPQHGQAALAEGAGHLLESGWGLGDRGPDPDQGQAGRT